MTKQELEQLCQPLTPKDVLEELESGYNEYDGDDNPLESMLVLEPGKLALKAAIGVFRKLIEDIDLAPTVQARRMFW